MAIKTYHSKEKFALESGTYLPDLKVAYHSFGQLNDQKDNVIWVVHALTANSDFTDWWAGLFGKGRLFDPEKYFIICANNLGSPYGSSSPDHINPTTGKRFGLSFPEFTLRDSANMIIKLMDHLNIMDIELLIGGSCGGNISLEIAILLKERIKNMALLCCSDKEYPWTIGIHESQRMILEADTDFQINKKRAAKKGLKAARAVALPYYRTSESLNLRQKEEDPNKIRNFKINAYLDYQGRKFVDRFDAHCYYKLLNALDTHNIGRNRESVSKALFEITANTLSIGIDSDLFIPPSKQKLLARHIPASKYTEIKSLHGHDAFLIETDQIEAMIKKWLVEKEEKVKSSRV